MFHVKHKCAWTANVICERLFLSVHCAFVGLLDVSWCRAFTWWGKLSDRIFPQMWITMWELWKTFHCVSCETFGFARRLFVKPCVVIVWPLCFGFFCSSVFYFTKNNDFCFMWNTNHEVALQCCFCKTVCGAKYVSYSTVSCETLCTLVGAFAVCLLCRFRCLRIFKISNFCCFEKSHQKRNAVLSCER